MEWPFFSFGFLVLCLGEGGRGWFWEDRRGLLRSISDLRWTPITPMVVESRRLARFFGDGGSGSPHLHPLFRPRFPGWLQFVDDKSIVADVIVFWGGLVVGGKGGTVCLRPCLIQMRMIRLCASYRVDCSGNLLLPYKAVRGGVCVLVEERPPSCARDNGKCQRCFIGPFGLYGNRLAGSNFAFRRQSSSSQSESNVFYLSVRVCVQINRRRSGWKLSANRRRSRGCHEL